MRQGKIRDYQRGFALPTVLIASVVMFIVLLTALGATSSISEALRNQHLNRISREAAQSGIAMARACLDAGTSSSTWTNSKPLKPNTDCSGNETTTCPTTSTDGACYVLQNGNYRTLYRVTVVTDSGGKPTGVKSEGVVRQVRTSNGVVSKEDTSTLKANLGGTLLTWKQVSVGGSQTCAVASNNKAYCWGSNSYGQLGDGTTTDRTTPVAVAQGAIPASATVRQVYAGTSYSCAIASDNKAYCWGNNSNGQLGDGTTTQRTTPVAVAQGAMPAGATTQQISAGSNQTCAIASDNKAYCWGNNTYSQLGDGTTTQRTSPVAVLQGAMPAGATVRQISMGVYHACAIASDNKAYCWGTNGYGQLGDNTTSTRTSPVAVIQGTMPAGAVVRQISTSQYHTCAIASDNKGYCWGYNSNGQLGDGTTANRATPAAIAQGAMPAGTTVRKISSPNFYHTCAIASDNKTYCWGYNHQGQLGDGTTTQRTSPVAVLQGAMPAGTTVRQVYSGTGYHVCAIASDNNIYCWGNNASGQLGDGTITRRTSPVAVVEVSAAGSDLITANTVATGSSHTCAIASDNKAYCWGYNGYGQLGDGTNTNRTVPAATTMPAGLTFQQISTNAAHTCAIASDNKAYCWGYNYYYQLGDGTNTSRNAPVAVSQSTMPAGLTFRQISVANGNTPTQTHTCAIASDNNAYCWGYNAYSQLGDGSTTTRTTPYPVSMPAGLTFQQIAGGGIHTCAIASDNKAYCWGYNYNGQVGDGTNTNRTTPVAVAQGAMPAGATFQQISMGGSYSCGIASDNKAYCWGFNSNGQLGNGTTTKTSSPVAVLQGAIPAGVTLRQISAGASHTCALASDNKAYCWGYNGYGQLGDGTTTQRTSPVAVTQGSIPAGATIREVAAGSTTATATCAIATDNKAYCWGYNGYGQLGDGTATNASAPSETKPFPGVSVSAGVMY